MSKSKSVSNEAINKILGKKVWPSLISQNNGNNAEELRLNQMINLSSERLRRERNYSRDIGVTESFYCAIGPILSIAQLFGVFPVAGIRSSSPSKLRFKPLSFLVIYSVFVIIMLLFTTIISVIHTFKVLNAETFQRDGGIGAATVGAVFYGNSLLGTILFFWLSFRWRSLQCEWRAMERYIDSNSLETPHLRWKFFLISFVILFLALVEHILSIVNNAEGYEWNGSNSTFRNFLEMYNSRSHSFIFDTLEYNFAFGLFIFIISKLATFVWNFTDLFIILVATGLAERYKCLNKKLILTVAKYRSRFDWHELREDYAALSSVVKKVDDHISPVILLSFANNLYFICLQLLNGISFNDSNIFSTIYFFSSFAFLIGRACAVTLLSARIHDQSKKALPFLYNCSASNYNIETQRLQYQLTSDDVALTGLRFFSITRNFMLAVAGAITTYEVVLLQFQGHVRN
ncbi:gustatory receptor for sugar taste 64f isoform X2 [Megachile rotundata]|uniref:gustatory receptor for sugar taste 64f isoform X2 n=1 Tax=Megachile rotundata TaxID=143995 RepID=UPI000258E9AE|nr:PREDICTED: gustatory receptor for sugar taste 64f-like isoform X2 [Megachile rotundata]